jgi:RimJ/RimL family protein N-acetyltransferase
MTEPSIVQPPFLVGDSIYLRALCEADVDGPYLSWLNDGSVCEGNSHHVYAYTRDQALAYVAGAAVDRQQIVLAMLLKQGHRHIGNVSLSRIDAIGRTAEFSILIGDRSEWGKGRGLEAARLLFAHGFSAMNLTRIACGTFATNAGMIALASALGMVKEGTRRRAAWKNGGYVDVVEFGLLREEFDRPLLMRA